MLREEKKITEKIEGESKVDQLYSGHEKMDLTVNEFIL